MINNNNLMKFLHQSFKRLTVTLLVISIHRQLIIAEGKKFCNKKVNKNCQITCANLNLNSANDIMHLEVIIKKAKWMHSTCTLKLVNCSQNNESNKVWNDLNVGYSMEIENLKIVNSTIDLSDTGLYGLRNLKRLTLINTTTTSLNRKIFESISNLRELRIENNKFLKSVERDFLQGTRLKYIKIQGLALNETETKIFFSNLTGDFSVPSVRELDWSFNNIGNFAKTFLQNFPNLNTLVLTNASILKIEEEAFSYGKINSLDLSNNKLQTLPEKVFKTIMKNGTQVFLTGNNFICDCQMEWLQSLVNKFKTNNFGDFQNIKCQQPPNSVFLDVKMCSETEKQYSWDHIHSGNTTQNFSSSNSESKTICNATGLELSSDSKTWTIEVDNLANLSKTPRRFNVTNKASESIEIIISKAISLEETFLWLMNYVNSTSPVFNCLKIVRHNFTVNITPESDYLICLASIEKATKTRFADCLPFKTKPTYENQTWLKRKSIFLSVICMTLLFIFASALGALILYLSIRKNPVLIQGSKRVIVVKRHDKAQILIMPRGCEKLNQSEGQSQALMSYNQPLLTSRSSLNCDSVSTASYVSANQPTPLEILTYQRNRLKELFQEYNEFPPPSAPLPVVPRPQHQRLPPNVDLLFEYEWYTITTTTTSQM